LIRFGLGDFLNYEFRELHEFKNWEHLY